MSGMVLHAAQARLLLLSQFSGKPNLTGLLNALMSSFQEVEKCFFQLQYLRSLDLSDGSQLDALGDILSQPRAGRSDAAYRDWLRAAVLRNTCDSTGDGIIRYVQHMAGSKEVQLKEVFPAGFMLINRGASVPQLAQLVREVAAAGVGPIVVTQAPEGSVTV